MIYLSGVINGFEHPNYGFIITPRRRQAVPAKGVIAADNDCFVGSYDEGRYRALLKQLPADRTLFATAPDVLGDHAATVERSLPALRMIRQLGLRGAFVAQDGWVEDTTPWGEFHCLFIGGTTAFKFRGGRAAAAAAKRRGKAVHVGRVNSLDRLRAAASIGANTVDGTYLKFGPDCNWRRLMGWLEALNSQHEMRLG